MKEMYLSAPYTSIAVLLLRPDPPCPDAYLTLSWPQVEEVAEYLGKPGRFSGSVGKSVLGVWIYSTRRVTVKLLAVRLLSVQPLPCRCVGQMLF